MSLAWEGDGCGAAISWFDVGYFGEMHERCCPAIVIESLYVIVITLRE